MADTRDTRNNPTPEAPASGNRLASLLTGRWMKWGILAVWLLVIAGVSPFAADLEQVTENDTAQWLPEGAESLQAYELEQRFDSGDRVPAVVVYHREDGLTAADVERAEADHARFAERYDDLELSPVITSEDGRAAMYSIPFRETGAEFFDEVPEIREAVSQSGDLQVQVTGPAGFTIDEIAVFDGIDTTLLIASASVVAVLLLVIYRSPFLWLVPLLVVGLAHQASSAMIYGFVTQLGLTANNQQTGLLPILVFGVGTDYALLLIARYREELRRYEDKHHAMANALRRAGPAILASAGTTIVGLLCLLAADINATQGLGPIGAAGIFSAFLAMVTLLPAVLLIAGRWVFWPFVPRVGTEIQESNGIWATIGRVVANRPRPVWIAAALLLVVLSVGFIDTGTHLTQEDQFRNEPESITGQRLITESFAAGATQPATVIARADAAQGVEAAIRETDGVVSTEQEGASGDLVAYAVTIDAEPSSQEAFSIIGSLRDSVHAVPDANALVGGQDAMDLDIANASERDRTVIIPLVLLVVLIILVVLLRAVIAPLIMVGTSILSFAAALGGGALVFKYLFDFPALGAEVILFSFVFLVTLGIDYNIFLMSRVREEAARHGTRTGVLSGLALTGGVITSAGVVLAATFAVVGVLPLVVMAQLGFIVAFGLLLETLLVRSILLPALTIDLDHRVWWPARLRGSQPRERAVGRPALTEQD